MSLISKVRGVLIAALVALALSACGGGSSSDGGQSDRPLPVPSNPGSPGAGNAAPSIQGTPGSTVLPGQLYTFQPTARDPDGDELTFQANNLPAWLTLNTSTGRISGTPSEADIGTYEDITITVSDGSATDTIGPFAITVSAVASGAATLSWQAPTQNEDGTALTDLAGYQVRYGQDADDLSQVVSLDNPSLTRYVVENLSSGTWYFAVSAVNSAGITSDLSEVVSKTIS